MVEPEPEPFPRRLLSPIDRPHIRWLFDWVFENTIHDHRQVLFTIFDEHGILHSNMWYDPDWGLWLAEWPLYQSNPLLWWRWGIDPPTDRTLSEPWGDSGWELWTGVAMEYTLAQTRPWVPFEEPQF